MIEMNEETDFTKNNNMTCHNNIMNSFSKDTGTIQFHTIHGGFTICPYCALTCLKLEPNELPAVHKQKTFICDCARSDHTSLHENLIFKKYESNCDEICYLERYYQLYDENAMCNCGKIFFVKNIQIKRVDLLNLENEIIPAKSFHLRNNTDKYSNFEKLIRLGYKNFHHDSLQMLNILFKDENLSSIFFALDQMKQFMKKLQDYLADPHKITTDDVLKEKTNNLSDSIKYLNLMATYTYKRNSYLNEKLIENFFNIFYLKELYDRRNKFSDQLIREKINILQGFRKMYINPKTKMPYMKHLCSGLINISPLHRLIFKDDISIFFSNFNSPGKNDGRKNYLDLLEDVYLKVRKVCYDHSDLKDNNYMKELFKEFIKLTLYMFYYKFDYDIIKEYLKKINDLKAINSNYVIKEKYVIQFLLAFNDLNYQTCIRDEGNLIANFIFNNYNYLTDCQKNLLGLYFDKDTSNSYEFINDEANLESNNKKIIDLHRIFDLYFNQNDYYIESLQANYHSLATISLHNQELTKEISDIISEFEKILFDYYCPMIPRPGQYEEMLTKVVNLLIKDENSESNSDTLYDVMKKLIDSNSNKTIYQIFLFKHIFKILYNLNKLFNERSTFLFENIKLKNRLKEDETIKIDEQSFIENLNEDDNIVKKFSEQIAKATCKILDVLVDNNPFLISPLFNDKIFQTMFKLYLDDYEKIEIESTINIYIDQFAKWFEILKNNKCKINVDVFCKKVQFHHFSSSTKMITCLKNITKIATNSSKDACEVFVYKFFSVSNDLDTEKISENLFYSLIKILCAMPNNYFIMLVEQFLYVKGRKVNRRLDKLEDLMPEIKELMQDNSFSTLKTNRHLPNPKNRSNFILKRAEKQFRKNTFLNLKKRIKYSEFISRCTVKSPFYIDNYKDKDFSEIFEDMNVVINHLINPEISSEITTQNLHLKIDDEKLDYFIKETDILQYIDVDSFVIGNSSNQEKFNYYICKDILCVFEKKMTIDNIEQRFDSKALKNLVSQVALYNFEYLIDDMRCFPTYLKIWQKNHSGDFKLLFKMFKHLILNQSRNILNKIIIFFHNITNKDKYYIYTVTTIFLKSFHLLVETLSQMDLSSKNICQNLEFIFFKSPDKNESNKNNSNPTYWKNFFKDLSSQMKSLILTLAHKNQLEKHNDDIHNKKNENNLIFVNEIDVLKIFNACLKFLKPEYVDENNKVKFDIIISKKENKIENFIKFYKEVKTNSAVDPRYLNGKPKKDFSILYDYLKDFDLNKNISKNIIKSAILLLFYQYNSKNDNENNMLAFYVMCPDSNKLMETFVNLFALNPSAFQKEIFQKIKDDKDDDSRKFQRKSKGDHNNIENSEHSSAEGETPSTDKLNDSQEKIENDFLPQILFNCLTKKIKFITNFIPLEYFNMNPDTNNHFFNIYFNIYKMLTLLCQDINKFFPQVISNLLVVVEKRKKDGNKTIILNKKLNLMEYTYSLIVCMLNSIQNNFHKKTHLKSLYITEESKHMKNNFYTAFFNSYFSLLNEFIQSLQQEALQFQNEIFKKFYLASIKRFKDIPNEIYDNYLLIFFKFIQTSVFEFGNIYDGISLIETKNIMTVLFTLYKRLYKMAIPNSTNNDIMTYDSHLNLVTAINSSENIYESQTFQMFVRFFIYMNNKASLGTQTRCSKLLNSLKLVSEMKKEDLMSEKNDSKNENTSNQYFLIQREIYLFFTFFIKRVEIRFKHEDEEAEYSSEDCKNVRDFINKIFKNEVEKTYEGSIKNFFQNSYSANIAIKEDKHSSSINYDIDSNNIKEIYFAVHPDSKYIDSKDIEIFLTKKKQEEIIINKLTNLIKFSKYMDNIVKMRKFLKNQEGKFVFRYIFDLDYSFVKSCSCAMSAFSNLLMIFSFYLQNNGNGTYSYDFPLIQFNYVISFLHLFSIGFFIYIKNSLQNNTKKFFEQKEPDSEDSDEDKKMQTEFLIEDFSVIYWNFAFGLIAMLNWRLNFLFSFQLLSIISLFPTMTAVIKAVQQKYRMFMAAAFIIVIFISFFAIFGVIFYQNEFYNTDLHENNCDDLLHCFLSLLYYGVRTGVGMGFSIKPISNPSYWKDFIIEWMFYFCIILVMLNIVNGIIVDTFQNLREGNSKLKEITENSCYICSISRYVFESNAINFEYHCRKEHGIKGYLDYIFYIFNHNNKDDFSSTEFKIYESIKYNMFDFFPINKAISLNKNKFK